MTGEQFETASEEINVGASIGQTLLYQFGKLAKSLIEQRRPWMVLRKTDTSKSVTAGNTWQTAIDLSTITDFNRFYGKYPMKLFDGYYRIERYRIVPFDQRLEYKEAPQHRSLRRGNQDALFERHDKLRRDTLHTIRSTAAFTSQSNPNLSISARYKDELCCLGILCDLYAKDTGAEWEFFPGCP